MFWIHRVILPLSVCLSLSVCISVSLSLPLSVFLSLSIDLSLSLFLSRSPSISPPLSPYSSSLSPLFCVALAGRQIWRPGSQNRCTLSTTKYRVETFIFSIFPLLQYLLLLCKIKPDKTFRNNLFWIYLSMFSKKNEYRIKWALTVVWWELFPNEGVHFFILSVVLRYFTM